MFDYSFSAFYTLLYVQFSVVWSVFSARCKVYDVGIELLTIGVIKPRTFAGVPTGTVASRIQ